MSKKLRVLVIVGGKSGEHEVSVRSGKAITQHLNPEKYDVSFLGITKNGAWIFQDQLQQLTTQGKVLAESSNAQSSTSLAKSSPSQLQTQFDDQQFDIIFPALHGTNGEDGRLQGLLEMFNLPYVGSGVAGSAVAMDKVIQKTLCSAHHIPQVEYLAFSHQDWKDNKNSVIEKIEKKLNFPLFVKPANLGSSVGVVKVKNLQDLEIAINQALQFDTKILVESGVENMKEIEVAILGNETPIASVFGAITPHTEFYDYETKYITDDIEVEIPAKIPTEISEKIRETAIKTFKILNCKGLARVDFFYQPSTQTFFLNELNTMPGFTSISMYPKLWEASGISFSELVDRLIDFGIEEWKLKQALKYSYDPVLKS